MNGELARHQIFMPEAANKWICGSSWGWLVLGGIDSMEVSLLNLLTRRVIRLPPVGTFTKWFTHDGQPNIALKGSSYIRKAILSTNPTISKQDCIIMAIVGKNRTLSYCRIGDKKWTNVEDPNSSEMVTLGLSIDRNDLSRNQRVPPALCHHLQYEWFEIDSIGDQLLFIGNNDSFSLPARRHSGKANCIYFTEHAFVNDHKGTNMSSQVHNAFLQPSLLLKVTAAKYISKHLTYLFIM
ncbi:F-box protein [Carex littledalei]|uniref:F-box protein n=1 Tax=Carex littledalei TaxID=544730 RepID=A0A833RDQ7_9POAL|nr:F-box protein [Carex littledalei]